jgi:hypothetical protein
MKKNMGSADRVIRLLLAVVVVVLLATNAVSGTLAVILGILAVIFVVTSAIAFCPLYVPFGLSTKKKS